MTPKQSNGVDVIIIVTILFVVSAMFFAFSNYLKNAVEEQNISMLQESTTQSEKYFSNIFLSSWYDIANVSELFLQRRQNKDFDSNDLALMERFSIFDYIRYVDTNGMAYSSDGSVVDVSSREYFKKGMAGRRGLDITFESKFTGYTSLVFYMPLIENDNVVGILSGVFGEEWLTEILSNTTSKDKEAVTYLCFPDGRVFGSSLEGKTMPNIIDFFREGEYLTEKELNSLSECFQKKYNYGFSYVDGSGEKIQTFVVPNERGNFVVVQTFPHSITERFVSKFRRFLLVIQVMSFGFFIVYIIFILVREMNKRLQDSADSRAMIKQTKLNLEDTVALLSDYYHKVLKLNLSDESFTVIKINDGEEIISEKISDWIKSFAESGLVYNDDVDKLKSFFKAKDFIQRFVKGEKVISIRYRRIVKGELRWVKMEIMKSLEFTEKQPIVMLYVIDIEDDISREIALETAYASAEKANKAKTDFLSSMSHEIRTPMNTILGMTAIAELHIGEEDYLKNYFKKLSLVSNHLMDLINDILDMNKIESGKIDLLENEFSLTDVFDSVVSMINPLLEAKGHKFNLNVDNIEHLNVIGDEHRLKQALMNFLSNAVKYTPNNGEISFSATEKQTDRKKLVCYEFIIKDNGIGMSEEFLQKLYNPFSRASDNRVQNIQGTGLGMSITKSIVQMMNGNINVESKLNEGTTFTVTVYLKCAKKRVVESSASKKDVTLKDFSNVDYSAYRVLLVDDNELNREITHEILSMTKLNVDFAVDGEDAVEKVSNAPEKYYDLIFMDVQMPRLNGYEATQKIRSFDREWTKNVPIIAMTANAFNEYVVEAEKAGMNGHVAKPLNFDVLLSTLEKWLS